MIEALKVKTWVQKWRHLSQSFRLMSRLALATAVIPHSTVNVESFFSSLKDFRSPKRNRLKAKNIEASLLMYQTFGPRTESILDKEMFAKYKVKYRREIEEQTLPNELSLEQSFDSILNLDDNRSSQTASCVSQMKLKRGAKEELVRDDLKKLHL